MSNSIAAHGQTILACVLLTASLCDASAASAGSSGPGDALSMVQLAVSPLKVSPVVVGHDGHDIMEEPLWQRHKADADTRFFDGVPVFRYSRAHQGLLRPRNQWIVVYHQNISHDMLRRGCRRLRHPAQCDHVSQPEKGELAFMTVHAYEFELRHSGIHRKYARYVQLDGPMRMNRIRGRQEPATPWGLDRIDQESGLDGRYLVQPEGVGSHIYHLDTGISTQLPEFAVGRAVPEWDITIADPNCPFPVEKWCSQRPAGQCRDTCAQDFQGHGTHTSGTICGLHYGVAKAATCHSVKVLDNMGTGAWSWFAEGINAIVSGGIRPSIISASLGGSGHEPVVEEAINRASDANIAVVVASGNEGVDACSATPGFVRSALVVGATDRNDKVADYSNWGDCVDIYAPGTSISSIDNFGREFQLSGTSQAVPHVAGAVAIEMSRQSGSAAAVSAASAATTAVVGSKVLQQGNMQVRFLQVQPAGPGVPAAGAPSDLPRVGVPSSDPPDRTVGMPSAPSDLPGLGAPSKLPLPDLGDLPGARAPSIGILQVG